MPQTKRLPPELIEYFLLGRCKEGGVERFTQDGGIVTDVWLAFAADLKKPQRVLISPTDNSTAIDLAYAIHQALALYRSEDGIPSRQAKRNRLPASVSPLENFVAVTIYIDELLRVILPLTRWWKDKHLDALYDEVEESHATELETSDSLPTTLGGTLRAAIRSKLGCDRINEAHLRSHLPPINEARPHRQIIQAAAIAALMGVFGEARTRPGPFDRIPIGSTPRGADRLLKWLRTNANAIARWAEEELRRVPNPARLSTLLHQYQDTRGDSDAPQLIQKVFLDRKANLADIEALATVKADAATTVFGISCKNITWAVIDSGIATFHKAFVDHDSKTPGKTRVRGTYDFTLIDRIRNFDIALEEPGSDRRVALIASLARDLASLPGRSDAPNFARQAEQLLGDIADQLRKRLQPDWGLIEPLVRLQGDDGSQLASDHGTHVAGVLGGDWRADVAGDPSTPESVLRGMCPDINLYDFRVLNQQSLQSTEFALLGTLEFIQHINNRAPGRDPVIHGINISMSIPHDVRNYGCGATPICVACDRLALSGVAVVAAAGNRGWNEQEAGFGAFMFCSITDPGNAQHVITVGSTHRNKPHTYGVSYFSSRGPTGDGRVKPDLVAPGEKIRGPIRGDAEDWLDGTSMAAPIVSGAAAMLMARHRELIGNSQRVKHVLCQTATDLGRERYFQGHGLVDVLRAIQSV